MKNLDLFSKRLLSICVGISIILLSGSLFLLSLQSITSAKADGIEKVSFATHNFNKFSESFVPDSLDIEDQEEEMISAEQVFGIGIREGKLYFGILYSNNTIGLHEAPVDGEDVLEW